MNGNRATPCRAAAWKTGIHDRTAISDTLHAPRTAAAGVSTWAYGPPTTICNRYLDQSAHGIRAAAVRGYRTLRPSAGWTIDRQRLRECACLGRRPPRRAIDISEPGLVRSKPRTRAGDFVCHRGESSGYSCAEVKLLDFAPAEELCGGVCLLIWVTVQARAAKGEIMAARCSAAPRRSELSRPRAIAPTGRAFLFLYVARLFACSLVSAPRHSHREA